jgi:methionine salvage enolase-phosphatase E1
LFVVCTKRYFITSVDGTVHKYAAISDVVQTYAKRHMTSFVHQRSAAVRDPLLDQLKRDRGDLS